MLGSNVRGWLRAAGHEVELFSQETDAWSRIQGVDVLVVDLNAESFDGVALVDSMLAGGELHHPTRTVGVYAHTDVEVRRRAEDAGFDLVLPRSRMAREGGALIGELADRV